ncbi:MAG: hypothetical protein ACKVX9_13090 [Blastocatellia bacterium]
MMRINKLQMLPVLLLSLMTGLTGSVSAQWGAPQYPNSGISRFKWEGIVDGVTVIYIQGRQVRVETRSGLPVQRQRYNFTDPLPRASVQLGLEAFNGRGRVRLIEAPRSSNGFTAVVRIEDNSGGRDTYGFELQWVDRTWRDSGGGWSGTNPRNSEGVNWRGRVDGESIIRFRGERAWEETISGNGVSNARARFSAPLPRRSVTVNLIDDDGRGDVVILEQPTRYNDYTAAVRVRDRRGGSGDYNFTLTWEQSRFRDDDDDRPYPGGGNSVRGLRWSGTVDGRDLIYIRGSRLWIDHREGQPIFGDNHRFFQPLPSGERANIFVRKLNGRGSVRVIEQPTRNNNFTAVIQVEDRDGGADRYEFEVVW